MIDVTAVLLTLRAEPSGREFFLAAVPHDHVTERGTGVQIELRNLDELGEQLRVSEARFVTRAEAEDG